MVVKLLIACAAVRQSRTVERVVCLVYKFVKQFFLLYCNTEIQRAATIYSVFVIVQL
jgi:hypothetical protein